MCGIVGKFNFDSKIYKNELISMANTLVHRGPDGEGYWINSNENIGFGHRRLSIIDLSEKGKQPMQYQDCIITYNGEIYNYIELKNKLLAKGYKFYTNTDTEVILASYKEYGKDCLSHFDGMFAFVIWDKEKQILFGARDRFGEKPFYYHKNNSYFAFASEMKALFELNISKTTNNKMIYNYLVYDVVENPYEKSETFYESIFQLPASHSFTMDKSGNLNIKKYWDIDPNKIENINHKDAIFKFNDLFTKSINRRMRSDVEVGTSFSGGLDSSSIVASIININPNISLNTFTARFNDKEYDEGNYVEILKNKYNFTSHYTWPKKESIIESIDKIFYHQEEPFGSTSIIAQWEVMKKAKEENVTVLLDGQGADETIAGYYKYFLSYLHECKYKNTKLFNKELNSILNNLNLDNYLPKSFFIDNKFKNIKTCIFDIIRPYRINSIAPDLSKNFQNTFKYNRAPFEIFTNLNSNLYNDTFKYGLGKLLRYSDRNAMAFSREVRLPYLSHDLVEFLFSLPINYKMQNGWSKKILRDSMNNILTEKITWRTDKKGFQAPTAWLKDKNVVELTNVAINKLKQERIITTPNKHKKWQYIMCYKLLQDE